MNDTFTSTWQSPSNIAIVKYWGKSGNQIPSNPSLSMTLKNSFSKTIVTAIPHNNSTNPVFEFNFHNQPNEMFKNRIAVFLRNIEKQLPFILKYNLKIDSKNNFPHSSGIASSAAFMSSLALCLCKIENQINGIQFLSNEFFRKASLIARLGSGSASRSVYGGYVSWGISGNIKNSSNEYATPINDFIHSNFSNYCDSILIISSIRKKISSSDGHRLMNSNPYSNVRYPQANENHAKLIEYLKEGDYQNFGLLVEHEALSLHAMMMISQPWQILFEPNTILVLSKIREFRESSKLPVYFTLDAGPNIHLLYSNQIKDKVQSFIQTELLQFCENHQWIDDYIGNGPVEIL
jgi:diphosphomevalonate decarboxylase